MLHVRVFFSVLHIKKERNSKVYQSDRQRVENIFWHEYVGSKYEVFGYSPIAFQFMAKSRGRCTK